MGDRTTFVGTFIPSEVKIFPSLLAKLPDKQGPAIVKGIVEACLTSFEGKDPETVFNTVQSTFHIPQETVNDLCAAVYTLLHSAYRQPEGSLKAEVFKEDLVFLGIPVEYHNTLGSAVFSARRAAVLPALLANRARLPTLDKLQWRVDVAISTSSLKRAMRPSVLMQMTLSNGEISTFELSVDQFHQLRYNVAYVLKEMEDIEKKGQA